MKPNPSITTLTAGTVLLVFMLAIPSIGLAVERIVFGGGPTGGTFQIFASAV